MYKRLKEVPLKEESHKEPHKGYHNKTLLILKNLCSNHQHLNSKIN